MNQTQHHWHYVKSGMLGDSQEGPVQELEIKELAFAGKIKLSTQVMSPTRTKGQWTTAKAIPALARIVNQGEINRKEQKAEERQIKNEIRQREANEKREQDLIRAEQDAIRADQDPKSVVKIKRQVSNYLTAGEVVEFVCVQVKPMSIKSDAVVVTNKRLMIVIPKVLGRFEFHDMLWRDLRDAHIKENIIGSTFTMNHGSEVFSIDKLNKVEARKLYQIAQHREEEAEETRRQRRMEETAAGAMQIVAHAPTPAATPSAPSDPMERLVKLKGMLDAGLINQDDFDKRKNEILSEV